MATYATNRSVRRLLAQWLAVSGLVLVLASGAAAQGLTGAVDYELGPGDLISIQVSGVREFQQQTRVANSGRIRVPFVGIMFAAGRTAMQLEREIAAKIKEHELVEEPFVRVHIEQYRAQPAYIIGEVQSPGQFVITGEMFLLDLISKAGGPTPGADQTALLYRRNSLKPSVETRLILANTVAAPPSAPAPSSLDAEGKGEEEVIKVDLAALQDGSNPDLNIRLQGGDILFVPRRQQQSIYIIGEVKVPGAYTLPRRGKITAAQAVIYAGGPMATAKMSNGFLMRHNLKGEREAIPVDFKAIIDGRKPDVEVQPDDIIFVPSSPMKQIAVGLLNLGPRLLQQFLIF